MIAKIKKSPTAFNSIFCVYISRHYNTFHNLLQIREARLNCYKTPQDDQNSTSAKKTAKHRSAVTKTMKVILITAHSHPERSHTYQVANKVEAKLKAKGAEVFRYEAFDMPLVKVRYDEKGEPIMNTDYDRLIEELKNCEEVVISTPMWNWSFPWALKNVIEGIIQNNKTFIFTKKGPKGTLTNLKRLTIYWTSGGPIWYYKITHSNFLVKQLPHIFKWIGCKKVRNFGLGGVMNIENSPAFEAHLEKIDAQW